MTPDQVDSVVVSVVSVAVAGLSFIYASKAQRATKDAEAARVRGQAIAVDAAAYHRARELYESAIDSLSEQNNSLQEQVRELRQSNDDVTRRVRKSEDRIAQLERFLIASGIEPPRH